VATIPRVAGAFRPWCCVGGSGSSFPAPSGPTDQGHELHLTERAVLVARFVRAGHLEELLRPSAVPDRNDEAPTDRELLEQRGGHLRTTGGHEDPVERGVFGPAERAVPGDDPDVLVSELLDAPPGLVGE